MPEMEIPKFGNDAEVLAWMGTDAEKWTVTFLHATDLANAGPDFQGQVLAWFANALGAGNTEGYARAQKEHNPHWPLDCKGRID